MQAGIIHGSKISNENEILSKVPSYHFVAPRPYTVVILSKCNTYTTHQQLVTEITKYSVWSRCHKKYMVEFLTKFPFNGNFPTMDYAKQVKPIAFFFFLTSFPSSPSQNMERKHILFSLGVQQLLSNGKQREIKQR